MSTPANDWFWVKSLYLLLPKFHSIKTFTQYLLRVKFYLVPCSSSMNCIYFSWLQKVRLQFFKIFFKTFKLFSIPLVELHICLTRFFETLIIYLPTHHWDWVFPFTYHTHYFWQKVSAMFHTFENWSCYQQSARQYFLTVMIHDILSVLLTLL